MRVSPFVLIGLFAAWSALMAALPVFPPLARQVGLTEVQAGVLISLSALLMALASPFWGAMSERWGRKPVFLIGLFGAAFSLFGFALVLDLGVRGLLAGPALFAALVLARMPIGLLIAAAPVAAQAYVADTTDAEHRAGGMAMIGAANAMGLIAGPAIAALLVAFGLLVPFYAGAALVLATALAVLALMPAAPGRQVDGTRNGLRPWDGRIWPFLLIGSVAVMLVSLIQVSIGFFLIDRLGQSVAQAARFGAIAFLVVGIVLVLVQGVLIPRMKWAPSRLLRLGLPVMAAGFAVLLAAPAAWAVLAAFSVMGLGAGLIFPGFQAAVTLMVDPGEQGAVAGLTGSANAAGAVIGPIAGTALYQLAPAVPYAAAVAVLALLAVFCWTHPRIAAARPAQADQATA